MKTQTKRTVLLIALATVFGGGLGCELLVDFDRTKIDAGASEGGLPDGTIPADVALDRVIPSGDTGPGDAGPDQGTTDAAGDQVAPPVDSGADRVVTDAPVDMGTVVDTGVDTGTPDTGVDAPVDAGVEAAADAPTDAPDGG